MERAANHYIDKNIVDILNPGDAVYLELFNSLNNKIVLKTTVKQVDDPYLTLGVDMQDSPLAQIHQGVNIVVYFRKPNRSNDFVFLAKFIRFDPEQSCLVLARKEKIFVGRNYFRLDVSLPFSYSHVREMRGVILNLSVSGFFAEVKPDERIRVGSTLACKILLPPDFKTVSCTAKITRLNLADTKYGIGATFINIHDEDLNQVNRYLFKRQQGLLMQKKLRVIK